MSTNSWTLHIHRISKNDGEPKRQKIEKMMRSILVLLSVVVLEVSSTERARPVYINSYDNFQQDVGVKSR